MTHRSLALGIALALLPSLAWAQCNGTFPPGNVCGVPATATGLRVPGPVAATAIIPPGGTNGQVQYNNNGILGGFTLSGAGDCSASLVVSSGVMTTVCLSTNGTLFGTLATTTPIGSGVTTAIGIATGSTGSFPTTIAQGTIALATGAISSATCAAAVTTTAIGAVSTDVLDVGWNSDPTGVTGYVPLTTGMLVIIPYPTSGVANFKVCNNTTATITPGAITLNWKVRR